MIYCSFNIKKQGQLIIKVEMHHEDFHSLNQGSFVHYDGFPFFLGIELINSFALTNNRSTA